MDTGGRIKEKRKEKGLTQAGLAALIGVDKSTVYRDRLAEIEGKIGNLVDAIASGVAVEAIKGKIQGLEVERAALKNDLIGAEKAGTAVLPSLQEIQGTLDRSRKAFEEFDVPVLRSLLARFVTRVNVGKDHLHILWIRGGGTHLSGFSPRGQKPRGGKGSGGPEKNWKWKGKTGKVKQSLGTANLAPVFVVERYLEAMKRR